MFRQPIRCDECKQWFYQEGIKDGLCIACTIDDGGFIARSKLQADIGDVPHERIEARAVDDAATVGDVSDAVKLGRYPPDPNAV